MDSLLLALRVLVSLAVVVALVWWLARRFGHRGEPSREAELRVLDRQSLSRHSGVAIVAAGDRRLLVGFSDQAVALVTELAPVPALPKAPASSSDEGTVAPVARLHHVPHPKTAATRAATTPAARIAATGAPAGAPQGLLAGSVLSPSTWQATVRALQDRTVRR